MQKISLNQSLPPNKILRCHYNRISVIKPNRYSNRTMHRNSVYGFIVNYGLDSKSDRVDGKKYRKELTIMAKQESYKTLEVKVTKQRELVQKEQEKLLKLETDLYRSFHEEVKSKASAVNMTVAEYLEAMS